MCYGGYGIHKNIKVTLTDYPLKKLMGGEDYGKVVLKISAETLDKQNFRVNVFVLTRIEAEGFAACVGCR